MTQALIHYRLHPLTSLSHSSIQLLHQRLRRFDRNHLIAVAVANQDPPSPDLLRQFHDLVGRLAVAPSRDGLQNEALAREQLVVLPLRDLLRRVPIIVSGEHAIHVGRVEISGGEEAGTRAGNFRVEGARDDDIKTFLEVLEKTIVGRDGGLISKARFCWLGGIAVLESGPIEFTPVWTSRAAVDRSV